MHAPEPSRMHAPRALRDAAMHCKTDRFEAVLFGKPVDYGFAKLVDTHPGYEEMRARLAYIAQALGVTNILAPSPTAFNAELIRPTNLGVRIHLEEMTCVWRNPHMPADVIKVPRGMAMAMSVGGCPALIAYADEHLFAAHAGRDSVIHRARIKRNAGLQLDMRDKERDVEGVVERIVRVFIGKGIRPRDIHIAVIGSIPGFHFPHRLDDPLYGDFNRALWEDILRHWPSFDNAPIAEHRDEVMCVDIPKLIAAQCLAMGLDPGKITLSHAYANPEQTWLDGTQGKERNLFMVVHR